MNKKILILDFDPVLPTRGGVRFTEYFGLAKKNTKQVTEDIVSRLHTASHGILNYTVSYETLDEFPVKKEKFRLAPEEFPDIWDEIISGGRAWWTHRRMPELTGSGDFNFDYLHYIRELNLVERRNNGEFDEIWFFAEFAGAFETVMVGKGAYWINGSEIEAECAPFRINSIAKHRDDTPLENLAHSAESILSRIYKSDNWLWNPDKPPLPQEQKNTWEQFTSIELSCPGNAAVGYSHFAPNSERDYDWGNTREVWSSWRDWKDNFPNLTGEKELVDNNTWGGGDNLDYHTWWFSCFPHVIGRDAKGYSNNWWEYYQNFIYTESLEIRVNTPQVGSDAYKINDDTDIQVFAALNSRDIIDVTFDSTINIVSDNAGITVTAWRDGIFASCLIP